MRLLIFLLALMSAFFVSADDYERMPAPSKQTPIGGFTESPHGFGDVYSSMDDAYDSIRGNVCSLNYSDCIEQSRTVSQSQYSPTKIRYEYRVTWIHSGGQGFSNLLVLYSASKNEYYCPPESAPLFKDGPIDIDGVSYCQKPVDCPAGYHSKAVSKALGSTDCVPKECPAAGTGENLASTPMTGGVPFSGGGMYCNDGCAYSVNAEQISSDKYAVGTSQGVACGDKPYDNKKLADEGDLGDCSVATNGEIDIMSCPNANPTTPEKDPHNNDDSKVGEEDTPEKPKETCADGDAACNLKNVETQIENSSNKIIDNDNELHNKKIDADTKNTQAILNIMESVDTSILLQTSQDERLHAVTISKYNQLIDAVNGLDVGGGGGGGNGNGNGTGEGDCEGSASDCVPIEGAEIPQETINLDQYADKYDDWLPNAELPSEKCIVLTNGKSICLSFDAFILLFQGISGLLVIGALMHSAKIISGAI